MNSNRSPALSRRRFLGLAASGSAVVGLGLHHLRPDYVPAGEPIDAIQVPRTPIRYGDHMDIYREKWRWDKIVKGTHTRANCISACAWDVYVKDGIAWREEQATIYEAPRDDVPDLNPRGCQKGSCYASLQVSESRILHPLKRAGERGEGKWERISWEQALTEIADKLIDAAIEQGTESIIFDNGTTNAGYGPETTGELRWCEAMQATQIDSFAGVGDMPLGMIQTWGMSFVEGTADDWFKSDYIVVWLGNPAYTRIPDVHMMHEARYNGTRLVVVAPDMNATAVHADLWINPKPETDAALALGVAQVMIAEKLYNPEYLAEQTDMPLLVRQDNGQFLRETDLREGGSDNAFYLWDRVSGTAVIAPGSEGDGNNGLNISLGTLEPELFGSFSVRLKDGDTVEVRTVFQLLVMKLNADYTPEKAGAITGLNPQLIKRFAREMAAVDTAMIMSTWGACKHYHSDLFQRGMILLMALTGNQGKQGGGLRSGAYWALDGLSANSTIRPGLGEVADFAWKGVRGVLTPRDWEAMFSLVSSKMPITPMMPFLYTHAGYDKVWDKPELQDPTLPRELRDYYQEAVDKGWVPIHPPRDRSPRAFLFTGCNPLRRWPAPEIAKKHFWPKLDLVVSVNFRMSTSSMFADYVLPAAAYYEKYGMKYGQTYLPYIITTDKATEPLGESKSEWEIFGRLSKRISERASQRGIGPVRGFKDEPLDLKQVYKHHTNDGFYNPEHPEDPVKSLDEIVKNSPNLDAIDGRDALRKGATRITGRANAGSLVDQNYSDYDVDDTIWPHRDFFEKKVSWPTLTGRQQFYIDHPWYLAAGEQLPVHKDPVFAGSRYPLRLTGGHTRWSIHAIWRDHKLLLRLQRGEPVCFLNPEDANARGIENADMVRTFNDVGSFECMVKLSPKCQPGQLIIYHAWEPYQFKGWKGPQEPVEAPWKALHLAGGYGQLHYRMFYGAPGHGPRGVPCDVEKT